MNRQSIPHPPRVPVQLIAVGVWIGLVTGIVEGTLFLAVNRVRHPDVLWAAAIVDALTVGAFVGLLVIMDPDRLSLRHRWPAWLILVFTFTFYDWLRVGVGMPLMRVPLNRFVREFLVFGIACLLAIAVARIVSKHWEFVIKLMSATVSTLIAAVVCYALTTSAYARWHERALMKSVAHPSAESPNVIVVIIDTLRADHLSAYGYARTTSPNLKWLAAHGVLFENAIAPSSWTLPSHASMLTGLPPHAHGAENYAAVLRENVPVIGELFAARGYATGAFSANPFFFCRKVGLDRGFIHFADTSNTMDGYLGRLFVGQTLDAMLHAAHLRRDFLGREDAAAINRKLMRWVDSLDTRPFFAVLNYFDVHDPYIPPASFQQYSRGRPAARISISFDRFPELNTELLNDEIDAYDDSIRYADQQLAALISDLRHRHLEKNTIVVVTSDHGEAFGEHGLITHGMALYMPLLHVPLVVWGPGNVPEGRIVSIPVGTLNISATLLGLAFHHRINFPGTSLAPLWDGTKNESADVVSELASKPLADALIPRHFPSFYGPTVSVTTPEWQYLYNPKTGPELYQWNQDPAETNNRAGDPLLAAVVARLSTESSAAVTQRQQSPRASR